MRNSTSDLADATEGQEDEQAQPVTSHEPAAADKSGDGTATQDNPGQHDTPEPTEADDLDAEIRAEFVADDGEGHDNSNHDQDQQPEAETPPGEQSPATGEQPPAEPAPQGDDHQPPAGDKPQEQAADRKTDEPTEEELRRYHPHARARIKNLAAERRKLTDEVQQHRTVATKAAGAIKALEDRAAEAGFTQASDLMDSVGLYGRALHKGDAEAKAEIAKRLGLTAQAPAHQLTPDIAEVLDDAEKMGIDTSKVRSLFQAPQQPPTAAPVAPPAQPQRTAPPARPAAPVASAPSQEEQAGSQALTATIEQIRQEHGANAPAIIQRITAEVEAEERRAVELTGMKIPPSRWKTVLDRARAKVLAGAASRPRGTPPPLRPNTKPGGHNRGPVDDLEAEILRDFVTD